MAPSLLNQAVKGPLFSIAGKLKQKNILRDITVIHKARVPSASRTSLSALQWLEGVKELSRLPHASF